MTEKKTDEKQVNLTEMKAEAFDLRMQLDAANEIHRQRTAPIEGRYNQLVQEIAEILRAQDKIQVKDDKIVINSENN